MTQPPTPQVAVVQDPEWDIARSRHLVRQLEAYGVDCVLDVGAHIGQFAAYLRDAGYAGRIVSFEPVPEHYERLAVAVQADPAWTAHRMALGRNPGLLRMNVTQGTGSSFLAPNEYAVQCWPGFTSAEGRDIEIRRLSDVIEEVAGGSGGERRLFLKSACPGYDLEILAGAVDVLPDIVGIQCIQPVLHLYHDMRPLEDTLPIYRASGFDLTGVYPITAERDSGRLVEVFLVMFRGDRVQ